VLASETGASPALVVGGAVVLAAVHVLGHRLRILDAVPRSRWLSGAGGVSVAYVFVHVLPELSAGHEVIESRVSVLAAFFEHHVYLVALLGFVTFYGVERLARVHARDAEEKDGGLFWIHVGSFGVYNVLVGRLLVHQPDARTLALFVVALGLHFLVNDHGLRDHHAERYRRVGQWLLAGGVLAGTGLGLVTTISEALTAVVFAFLAGGIVLNVVKEELPEERESSFTAFAGGAVGYTVILIAL
jgi:zinc transporter ZupT